ncbi:MAG: hypothetical protein SVM80_13660 [Halobacteriota archaeon]|nr:hypothetical protein [Halobacteriota archaeon]
MSRKGNCWDNAPMESFFHSLKTEWAYRTIPVKRQKLACSITSNYFIIDNVVIRLYSI